MEKVSRRLKQIQNIVGEGKEVLVLPDDGRVTVRGPDTDGATTIAIDSHGVLAYRTLPQEAALVLSALGTPFEKSNPTPKYSVLELSACQGTQDPITIPDLWAAVYALWTLLHTQETIPFILAASISPGAADAISSYLLLSGLARRAPDPTVPELFLLRGAFWQGAGTGPAWGVARGWLRRTTDYAAFPSTASFTRSSTVIAAHPLRAPKPPRGAQVYRRFCSPVGRTLSLHVLDPESEGDMEAFHRWMNDPRVSSGWGEQGDEEHHRRYVAGVERDPHVLPLIMSWDGERMGYAEIVWIKENHVATFVPTGAQDHDRGLHVLVGEDKFRGQVYSQAWFRSVTHYMFLADPRTARIIGEPKRNNPAIIRTSIDAGMHLETSFYFPYKHSVMTCNLRERFFKEDMLH
ncbi:hypothetical protein M0805_009142 [Coniferiporia weirii]|nr:hypothetical protein M0805_009142 [Coniferiporia weirii]